MANGHVAVNSFELSLSWCRPLLFSGVYTRTRIFVVQAICYLGEGKLSSGVYDVVVAVADDDDGMCSLPVHYCYCRIASEASLNDFARIMIL